MTDHPTGSPSYAGTVSVKDTWVAMFEPERFPPPRLSGVSLAWRYGLALLGWVLVAVGYIANTAFSEEAARMTAAPAPSPGASALPTPAGTPSLGPSVEVSFPGGYEAFAIPPQIVLLDLFLGVAVLGIVHLRRRFPLTIFLVVHALAMVSGSAFAAALWVWLSLTSRRDLGKSLIALVFMIVTSIAQYLLPWAPRFDAAIAVVGILFSVAFGLLGAYIGVRRDRHTSVYERAEQADRDREFAVLAERNRIAREMHDVLAHRISLVSMHAGALAFRDDLPPAETKQIAKVIQENAHASLTELRLVLSSLREDPTASPEAPQPTLADLPALLADARASGQVLTLSGELAPGLPLVQQRHLYRIVQECLTNARKHAPRSRVDVSLSGATADGVRLLVANDVTQVRGAIPGAKLGLVGITERAQMLGGTLDAGVRGGRFVVEAWLPWDHHHRRRTA